MLTPEKLQNFFERHNIPLSNREALWSPEQILTIFKEAIESDEALSKFVLYALVNPEKTKIETNFTDYNDLYEGYVHFSSKLFSKSMGKS